MHREELKSLIWLGDGWLVLHRGNLQVTHGGMHALHLPLNQGTALVDKLLGGRLLVEDPSWLTWYFWKLSVPTWMPIPW